MLINPLTTDDAFWSRQFLAACYQLKIGSALAVRVGQVEVGGALLWLTVHIECSLMSGCGQGHEPTGNVSIKLQAPQLQIASWESREVLAYWIVDLVLP